MTVHYPTLSVNRPGYVGGGNWDLTDLSDVTVIFGRNGSGKSVLLRQCRDARIQDAHYVVPERAGEVQFQAGYLEHQLDAQRRRDQSIRNYVPTFREQTITRITAYFSQRGSSREDGPLPVRPDELEHLLGTLVPDFDIVLETGYPPYVLTRRDNNQRVGGVDQLSSGEAQLFTLGLDILTITAIWTLKRQEKMLLLVDEPDAHVHPDMQVRFADFLFQVVDRYRLQVLIATHSVTLLAALGQIGGERTGVVYLNRSDSNFRARPFDATARELSACLGGHLLAGPLFGFPLLLVEGDDDWRIWSQVPRHHTVQLACIPCNGQEIDRYQALLEEILSSLSEPLASSVAFALLDGDRSLPQPNDQRPQAFVKFVRLNCREAENLYLSDQVLSDLGITWDHAATRVESRAAEFGQKAELLRGAATWDRKRVDIKNCMEELTRVLDPKNVHWTLRVGRCIGRARPEGQLADFLGVDLITALWRPRA